MNFLRGVCVVATFGLSAARRSGLEVLPTTRGFRSADGSLHFLEAYGVSGNNWNVGDVGTDVAKFGDLTQAPVPATVALLSAGAAAIGNTLGSDQGIPSLTVETTDGIMGICPGCMELVGSTDGGCPNGNDDFISSLVKGGIVNEWAMSVCFKDIPVDGSDDAGSLHLGMPTAWPSTVQWIDRTPTDPSHWTIAPSTTSFKMGDTDLLEVGSIGNVIFDSGAVGIDMSSNLFNAVFAQLGEIFFQAGGTALTAIEACAGATINNAADMTNALQSGYSCSYSQLEAQTIVSLVPDLIITLDGIVLPLLGHTFLVENNGCSGSYNVMWTNGGPSGGFGTNLWGPAFLVGKLIHFDEGNARIGFSGAAGDCSGASGQPGLAPIQLSGSRTQFLGNPGVITAKVLVGTPAREFVIQLDLGSNQFILQYATEGIYGFYLGVQLAGPNIGFLVSTDNRNVVTNRDTESFNYINATLAEGTVGVAQSGQEPPNVEYYLPYADFLGLLAGAYPNSIVSAAGRTKCGMNTAFDAASTTYIGTQDPILNYANPPTIVVPFGAPMPQICELTYCQTHESPCCSPGLSCEDAETLACVVAFDSFCGYSEWDLQCVSEAVQVCGLKGCI